MAGMGANVIRTQADDLADAAAALAAATREMDNWRGHLRRISAAGTDTEALTMQARRSGRIVAALVAEAESKTRAAGYFLRSVS